MSASIADPSIAVEEVRDELLRTIGEGLRAHNIAHGGAPAQPDEFIVTLRSGDGGLIGGITCDLYLGGLLIEWAWIEETRRGQGYGSRLLAAAERHGQERGASFAHLDTFTFQARDFYERHGYEIFGVLPYPGGIERFYMRKGLADRR